MPRPSPSPRRRRRPTTRSSSTATRGSGKTHLLHAIGDYALSLYAGIRVRYVSSEEFTNDFINSIANNRGSAFQARYRDVDILLIDDIQFLQGRAETQEAFFHTFNTLHDHDKQVVITSDVPPEAPDRIRRPDAQPVRVGPHHRRAGARPRDAHRDPPQEGAERAAPHPRRGARVHRDGGLVEHPRARGRAHPRLGIREPEPLHARHVAGADRAARHRRPG